MGEHDTYTLRATPSGWEVRLNGQPIATFDTLLEAEQAAISGIRFSREQGRAVQMFVQTQAGTIDLLLSADAPALAVTSLSDDALGSASK